ncbi:hypothetical protein K7X08_031805 [Anisodus acutangulus]|uniref:Uncharacterized protein n=1 Tax=Anisodus acutangulus TaxID=402998 RepID=A0A9Q1MM20_9SOLA|nr:hypothetical protein K7X08_031805 [Anisodus acutangulus]
MPKLTKLQVAIDISSQTSLHLNSVKVQCPNHEKECATPKKKNQESLRNINFSFSTKLQVASDVSSQTSPKLGSSLTN